MGLGVSAEAGPHVTGSPSSNECSSGNTVKIETVTHAKFLIIWAGTKGVFRLENKVR
jgi:hypothetical protein